MFLTHPQFKQFLPPALYGSAKEGHCAIDISTHLPWFLFSFMQAYEDGSFPKTIAVATEATLLEFVEALPSKRILGVFCISAGETTGSWFLRRVEELWRPSDAEEGAGHVLFKFEGCVSLRDAFMTTYGDVPGRSLLYQCAE